MGVNTKVCTACKEELPKEDFHTTSSSCKPCKKEYNKEYGKKRKKLNKYSYKWDKKIG
tara:strand:+ start:155 stop:328 length:174 start_codon:yes stop_codon:yes gene_type:complete